MLPLRALSVLACGVLAVASDATAQSGAPSPDAIVQQAYLKASNTKQHNEFGYSVAVSGDTVVVGAPYEDSSATGVDGDPSSNDAPSSGAAYVFVRSGSAWSSQAFLKASNTGMNDRFGSSVAIDGDTIVVGATSEDSIATGVNGDQGNGHATDSGAAYVFVRNGTSWSQQAYLKASNTEAHDVFGASVSVSGDTVVVGAYGEDSRATGVNGDESNNHFQVAGAAYVFLRTGTTWSQQAYLKASNTQELDTFGWSVSVSGETLVVAAIAEDGGAAGVNGDQADNSAPGSGAVYVFERNGADWSQQAYVKASNPGQADKFGNSVSVSGDMLAVGAPDENSNAKGVDGDQRDESAVNAGATYTFARSGTTWSQQAYLKASNTDPNDGFGWTVSASGDLVIVGARGEDSGWAGVNGNQSLNGAPQAGAAYAFARSNGSWTQQHYFKGSNTTTGDAFGASVSVSGRTIVGSAVAEASGATGVDGNQFDNSAPSAGAAYVLELDGWTNLGFGLTGSTGIPLLVGSGPLSPNSANHLDLLGANPSALSALVFGLSQLDAPFKGGTLVPGPLLVLQVVTDSSGAMSLPFTWPAGVPADTALYFQFWVGDASAVAGLAASNGLKGVSD